MCAEPDPPPQGVAHVQNICKAQTIHEGLGVGIAVVKYLGSEKYVHKKKSKQESQTQ